MDPSPRVRRACCLGIRKRAYREDENAGEVANLLAPLLRDPDDLVRREASRDLFLLGKDGVPHLVAALKDPDPEVRRAGTAGLSCWGMNRLMRHFADPARPPALEPQAVQPLRDALTDPDAFVRFWAAQALSDLPEQRSGLVPVLKELERDADPEVRRLAAFLRSEIESGKMER
jgi:HEAT repeat protein